MRGGHSVTMVIDSHCHLTDSRFTEDLQEVLRRARSVGVEGVISIASNRADARQVVELVGREDHEDIPALWGTVGVHPHDAEDALPGDLDALALMAEESPRIVAVGETGLDFFYDNSPREVQEELFSGHLALAERLGLPVVVHSRNADGRTAEILKEWGTRVSGVLHCFTGGEDLLHIALELGWMVSFTGIITFKSYDGQALLRSIPRERLMVETDGPYLAPVPHRGRRNEPSFVVRVAEELAALREEDPLDVMAYTTENAVRFFNLRS